MTLADAIVDHNEAQAAGLGEDVDEFGIPIPLSITAQYLVARALLRDEGRGSINGLHLREGEIWKGHERVEETMDRFYILTGLEAKVDRWIFLQFWFELKRFIPKLDRSKLEVAGGVYWDIANGGLIWRGVSSKIKGKKK